MAGPLSRRVGTCDRREPLGPRHLPQLEDLSGAHPAARRSDRCRLRGHLGGRADPIQARRRLRARLSGWQAAEQFQCHVSSRGPPPGPRSAGGRRALRLIRAQQPRGVLDAALARSLDPRRRNGQDPARASFRGFGRRLQPHVMGGRCHRARVQGWSARGASGRNDSRHTPRMAARQRPRAPRRRQLRHLGAGSLPDGRHRLCRLAIGAESQHPDIWRRRPGRRDAARCVASHGLQEPRPHSDSTGRSQPWQGEDRGGPRRCLSRERRRGVVRAHLHVGRWNAVYRQRCRHSEGAANGRVASPI